MQWHYVNDGVKTGPVDPKGFERLVTVRVVRNETLVWSPGWPEWRAWNKVAPETAVCLASGGRHLIRDMVPYEGRYVCAEEKDVFFQKLREGVSTRGIMIYGGFWMRFLAKFIDMLVLGTVNTIIVVGLSKLLIGTTGFVRPGERPNVGAFFAFQGLAFVVGVGLGLLYTWFFLSRHAATPGKMALGLKIVRSDGTALTNGRIVGRYFAEMINGFTLYIGYILVAFDSQKRGLHDQICDTRVIKAR